MREAYFMQARLHFTRRKANFIYKGKMAAGKASKKVRSIRFGRAPLSATYAPGGEGDE